jgi:hypothetical protein
MPSAQSSTVRVLAASALAVVVHAACGGREGSRVAPDPVVDVTNAKSWLIQKVCADARGAHPIDPFDPNDPYGDGGCPSGMVERDLLPTDALPYYRYSDLTGATGPSAAAISLPVWDSQGGEFLMMQRSFNPDGTLVFDTNYSHFDTYRIGGDWISQYGTRDNGSFNATFFGVTGGSVTPYNGWTDFPATNFLSTSVATSSDLVLGCSWELCGVSPPGVVPASPMDLPASSLQYQLLTAFPFGSMGGTRKVMNTIAASHEAAPNVYPANGSSDAGHTEIWYFTVPYGPTRWEVWSAAACLLPHAENPNPPPCGTMAAGEAAYVSSGYCSCLPAADALGDCEDGPTTKEISYMGEAYTYVRTVCRDWSNVVPVASSSRVAVPYWPSPQANLLRNFHFSDVSASDPTDRTVGWAVPSSLTVSSAQSTALYDTTRSGDGPPSDCAAGVPAGVRYVTMKCAEAPCAALSQDVPLASYPAVMTSGTYAFGVTARTDLGGPNPAGAAIPTAPTGTLLVSVEQIDANGDVVGTAASAATSTTVGPAVAMNVTSAVPATQDALIASVVLSSAYVTSTTSLALDPTTTALRLGITSQSPGVTFDIVDASLSKVGPP